MSTWKYTPGDKVTIRTDALVAPKWAGTHWIVTTQPRGARGKNYVLSPLDNPAGAPITAPESLLTAYTGEATGGAVVTTVPLPPRLPDVGTVVKLNIPGKVHPDALWVVAGDSGQGKSRVFPLGGGARYWRVPPTVTTVVPPAELAAALPAHLATTTK